jgi:cytochrome c-type biogenesis protein CcmH
VVLARRVGKSKAKAPAAEASAQWAENLYANTKNTKNKKDN